MSKRYFITYVMAYSGANKKGQELQAWAKPLKGRILGGLNPVTALYMYIKEKVQDLNEAHPNTKPFFVATYNVKGMGGQITVTTIPNDPNDKGIVLRLGYDIVKGYFTALSGGKIKISNEETD